MKDKLYYISIISLLFSFSCSDQKRKEKQADYKLVELNYSFQNYMDNIRDTAESFNIRERDILIIDTDVNGISEIDKKLVSESMLVIELKKFIVGNPEDDKMPSTIKKKFSYSGEVDTNKRFVILAKYPQDISYQNYRKVRDKIFIAYSEVRNDFAVSKFGKTVTQLMNSSDEVERSKWNEILQIYPMMYTELLDK